MAWTAPMTAVTNAVLTAAQWNANVRDNLAETAVAKATTSGSFFTVTGTNTLAERTPTAHSDFTPDTTTSTSFTDLAASPASPTVTLQHGGRVLISLTGSIANNTVNATSDISFEATGSYAFTASGIFAIRHTSSTANAVVACSYVSVINTTPGTSTFTHKYRVSGGTGTFDDRRIAIVPF